MKKSGNETAAANKKVSDYTAPAISPTAGKKLIMVGSELGIFSVKESKNTNVSPGSVGRKSH